MNYSWSLSSQFEKEFDNFPQDQQDKIIDFTDVYEENGLSDFSLYEGKIAPSWSGSAMSQEDSDYAKDNDLWHYHIGIPEYAQMHPKYKTSDWVLHFQWPDKGDSIKLVDLYSHYLQNRNYYLPPASSLSSAPE